jgi:cell wall-associated NlpC family hydrolase
VHQKIKSGPARKRIRLALALLFGSSAVVAAAVAGSGTAMAATTAPGAAHASTAPVTVPVTAVAASAQFSKKGAVAWALANVNGTNNGFADDCADFVSRALQAGGYPFSYVPSVVVTNSTNDKYWYYFTVKFGRHYPHSWSVAHDLAVHLVDMKSTRVLNPKNAQPGDVIFANWNGTSFAGISHVGIITGMSKGVPLITQHTPSQKNISLTYWLKHGGRNVHVWIYSPNP